MGTSTNICCMGTCTYDCGTDRLRCLIGRYGFENRVILDRPCKQYSYIMIGKYICWLSFIVNTGNTA